MDLELSQDETLLAQSLAALFAAHAGHERAREMRGHLDNDLVRLLADQGYLDVFAEGGPIAAVLVAEHAAAAVAAAPVTARALVGPLAGATDLPATVALVDMTGRERSGLVRYAGHCAAYLILDGDEARIATDGEVDVVPVISRAGYPMGRVTVRRSNLMPGVDGAALRRAWQVGIAVEASSMALATVEFASRHVTDRMQFGRPIGSFQAVQHRLARSYALAQATRWMARRAAWHHTDEYLTASAATFAAMTAREVYDNCHQVVGGIGITDEYGMTEWTMRLLALHTELGGRSAHARRVAASRAAHLTSIVV